MSDFFTSYQPFFAILLIITCVLSVLALIISIVNTVRIKRIREQTKTFFAGKNGADLEEILTHNNQKLIAFDKEIQELFNISNTINKQAHKSLHKLGIVRFNPFGERAGNQSFALALLNSNDNGFVLSSLHTREGTRIYTKQITKGAPVDNELTEEEKEAIQQAH
jgi:predicted PurR-regulated permease PerM